MPASSEHILFISKSGVQNLSAPGNVKISYHSLNFQSKFSFILSARTSGPSNHVSSPLRTPNRQRHRSVNSQSSLCTVHIVQYVFNRNLKHNSSKWVTCYCWCHPKVINKFQKTISVTWSKRTGYCPQSLQVGDTQFLPGTESTFPGLNGGKKF